MPRRTVTKVRYLSPLRCRQPYRRQIIEGSIVATSKLKRWRQLAIEAFLVASFFLIGFFGVLGDAAAIRI